MFLFLFGKECSTVDVLVMLDRIDLVQRQALVEKTRDRWKVLDFGSKSKADLWSRLCSNAVKSGQDSDGGVAVRVWRKLEREA